MKTNVIMLRKMGEFNITQRTQDGYFNATLLLNQWNDKHGTKKEIKEFFSNKSTKEFINTLINEELSHGGNSPYHTSRANKGQNMGTWMHPYLFLDFAMWINPRFKLDVIRFVYDQLIQYRHSAGDNYRGLAMAVARFGSVNYAQLAKGLNYLVFGIHDCGLRQKANEEQLHRLTELEKQFAFAVDMGLITSYDELMNHLRRIWRMQHNQFITKS
jgi:hypothetical protein